MLALFSRKTREAGMILRASSWPWPVPRALTLRSCASAIAAVSFLTKDFFLNGSSIRRLRSSTWLEKTSILIREPDFVLTGIFAGFVLQPRESSWIRKAAFLLLYPAPHMTKPRRGELQKWPWIAEAI